MSERFFEFNNPEWMIALLILPLLYFLWRRLERRHLAIGYSSLQLFSGLSGSLKQRLLFLLRWLRLFTLILIVIALMRPQLGNKTTEVLSEGVDILLTIDTSGSMRALDFNLEGRQVDRLEVVKKVVSDFIDRREHDRIGMVVFGENAFTQCPLTHDRETLKMFLSWLKIGIVGDGTAIGNALATGVKRLKDQKAKSRVIILLTDGRNNAGEISPTLAAQLAQEFDIKVHTIGVGSKGPVPYPEQTPWGRRIIRANLDLDEETLRAIAEQTGGQYFRAQGTEELHKIYALIDQMEKTEIRIKEFKDYQDWYHYLTWGVLLLLIMEIILSQTYFMRIP